ncbi:MAG TPA: hypothetical protein VFZ73_14395 [Gemmatimonadaceae bacterium]
MTVKHTFVLLALVGLATACVDSPSAPLAAEAPNNPLATSFDLLADEQAAANDIERSEEFRWAALALRAGVTPRALEVTNNGQAEVYDAFVHSVTWAALAQALRPPLHRSLIAWRRSGDRMQVILIGLALDSAPVVHPLSLRPNAVEEVTAPYAGAKAAYFERGPANTTWMGIGGTAKVADAPDLNACPTANDASKPSGINCQLTRFSVALNVQFAKTLSRDSRDLDPLSVARRIIAPDQALPGVKLVFTCAMPSSTGC